MSDIYDNERDHLSSLFRHAPGEMRLGDEPPGVIADRVIAAGYHRVDLPPLADLVYMIAAGDLAWSDRTGDPQAEPAYIRALAEWALALLTMPTVGAA